MEDEYTKGQEKLIEHIKSEISRTLNDQDSKDENLLIDIVLLLRGLKPIEK